MLFETYDEKVEYCQDILNETLVHHKRRRPDGLKISGQIVNIVDDVVEFDIYIEDQLQTLWLPFTYFKTDGYHDDGCGSLSFILFTFFEGVRRGLILNSKSV